MAFISVFDVLGPNMIGPSSSHTAGAEIIAFLAVSYTHLDVYKRQVQRGQVGEQGRTAGTQGIRQGGGQQVQILPEKSIPHGSAGRCGCLLYTSRCV